MFANVSEFKILGPRELGKPGFPFEVRFEGSYADLPNPKISFIVPSYNQGQYLEECLRSIWMQGYENIEILVGDGGSTDNSVAILEHYTPLLAWWESKKDLGTWDANNKCLAKATGEFWWVVNSDDRLELGAIHAFLVALASSPAAKWFTGKVNALNAEGETKAVFSPQKQEPRAGLSFLRECWIYHPATILHRDLGAFGFTDTDLLDWDLWIRLEKAGFLPVLMNATLAGLRFHEGCKSNDSLGIYERQIALLSQNKTLYLDGASEADCIDYDVLLEEYATRLRQIEIKTLAYDGKKGAAIGKLIAAGLMRPAYTAKRWYWGLLRRIFTSFTLDEVSPLAFLER